MAHAWVQNALSERGKVLMVLLLLFFVAVFCCCFLGISVCLIFFCFVFVLMGGRDRIKIPLTRAIIESSFLLIGLLDKYHKCNGNGLVIIYILPYL